MLQRPRWLDHTSEALEDDTRVLPDFEIVERCVAVVLLAISASSSSSHMQPAAEPLETGPAA